MEKEEKEQKKAKPVIAKKDWRISSGAFIKGFNRHEIDIQISAGQDVAALKLEQKYLDILKVEEVI